MAHIIARRHRSLFFPILALCAERTMLISLTPEVRDGEAGLRTIGTRTYKTHVSDGEIKQMNKHTEKETQYTG